MKRIALPLFFLAALVLPAVSFAQTSTAHTTTARSAAHRTDPALYHPSMLNVKGPDTYEAKFITTKGDFVIQVTRAWSPLGADRFYNLVRHHFFDDASFFRVVSGFIIQFGLSPTPSVNKALDNATIKDDPVTQSNRTGTITFATSGPNTRSTQVFINLGDNSSLDSQGFAPFGQVTSGMDVVQALYSGYGDLPEMGGRGPSEATISAQGKPYLDKNFPKLDSIISATIISPAPSAPAHPTTHKSTSGAASASSPRQ
jgi:peptidyl-prolyl cis-trans isomerase A (cyclophilin A)